jgi:hypothetical protein
MNGEESRPLGYVGCGVCGRCYFHSFRDQHMKWHARYFPWLIRNEEKKSWQKGKGTLKQVLAILHRNQSSLDVSRKE